MKPKILRITDLLRPHWKAMTMALAAVAVGAAMDLLEPWPIKIVLDYLLQSKRLPAWMIGVVGWIGDGKLAILNFAVVAVAAIAVVGAVSSYLEDYLTTNVGQWVMHDLRRTLYHHIHRLSLAEHDEKRTGDLIGRVTSDIDSVQDFVASALLGIVTSVLTLLGIIGVMLYMNWRFTLISLSIAPFLFLVVYYFTRRIKKASRAVRKKESELVSTVEEVFSSIRLVKAFAREDYEERRFERQSLDNVETALVARSIKMKLAPIVDVIVAIGTCLMLGYGARLVMAGQLTAGDLVVFLFYLGKMYKPMRDLSKMTDTVSKAGVGFERIREILETESAVRDLPRARQARRASRATSNSTRFHLDTIRINRFSKMSVSRSSRDRSRHSSVRPEAARQPSSIWLRVSTIRCPAQSKLTERDIRAFTIKSIRDQISFVLQDTVLFHTPIWENIAYGRPEATRAEIIRAAELANAHEFIEKMPEGYDTMVGERGVTLSGGQRQRIAIARAVIRNTPILILDEPTSGLDAQSEQAVFEALERLMKNKTSIVIAHHLATILDADTIFVVKDSELKERGTHEELIAAGGFYSELYDIQNGEHANAVAK